MSHRKQLIDPLATICTLVKLYFNKKGARLCIAGHIVSLDPPGVTQAILRTFNGESGNNIVDIYPCIVRVIKWYLIENPNNIDGIDNNNYYIFKNNSQINNSGDDVLIKNDISSSSLDNDMSDTNDDSQEDKNNLSNSELFESSIISDKLEQKIVSEQDITSNNSNISLKSNKSNKSINENNIVNSDIIKRIMKYLCLAFEKLQETYEMRGETLYLQYYINLINDALNGNFNSLKLPKPFIKHYKEDATLIDFNKFKNLWKYEDLNDICEMFDKCFSKYNGPDDLEKIKRHLNGIDTIIKQCNKNFLNLIENNNKC